MKKRLFASTIDKKLGGVCGVLAYFIAWIIIPEDNGGVI